MASPTIARRVARAFTIFIAVVGLAFAGTEHVVAAEVTANDTTVIEHDLALILVKAPGQSHQLNLQARPAKAHFIAIVANQGAADATNIEVLNRRPAGTAFSVLSTPVMPRETANGAVVAIRAPHASSDIIAIDRLRAGDRVAIPLTLEVTDESPGRFVHEVEISSFAGADGEPVADRDSMPDAVAGNDTIDHTPGIDPDGLDPANSHNNIDYDQTAAGAPIPTPNDEDDHDTEVVIAPPIAEIAVRVDPTTTEMPIVAGGQVTFLVDVVAGGAPIESVELLHPIDADNWGPLQVAQNPVSSLGGRALEWSTEDGVAKVTMAGTLYNGEYDSVPIVLDVPASFSGSMADLAHRVTLGRLNGLDPVMAREAHADAQVLDLALRLSVDQASSQLPPAPGGAIAFTIEVFNQGSLPATDIEVFDHIDFALWDKIDIGLNGPGTTTGDAALSYSWQRDEFGAVAELDGVLAVGQRLSLPVVLVVSDRFVDPLGYLANEAEVSAATAIDGAGDPAFGPYGDPVVDIDSLLDRFNYDNRVDDVLNNAEGDEDDHDVAFLGNRFSLGDQIWIDANADGEFGSAEQGVSDIALELVDSRGVVVASTTTNGAGVYSFVGLDPGAYVVQVEASAIEIGGPAFGAATTAVGPIQIGADGVVDNRQFDLGLVLPQSSSESLESDASQTPMVLAFTGPGLIDWLVGIGLACIAVGLLCVRVSSGRTAPAR